MYRVTHKKSFDSAEPAQSATRVRVLFSGYVKKQKEEKNRTKSDEHQRDKLCRERKTHLFRFGSQFHRVGVEEADFECREQCASVYQRGKDRRSEQAKGCSRSSELGTCRSTDDGGLTDEE